MVLISILVKGILLIIVGFVMTFFFIRLTPLAFGFDVREEVKKGNVAASVFALGLFLFMGIVIGFLLSSAI